MIGRLRLRELALGLTLAWAGATPAAAQCAMCRTALTQSPEGRAMAESFNRAILLMLAAPYAVFGAGTTVFFLRRGPKPRP